MGLICVTLNSNNISQYYCFYCILDQIDAVLVSRRECEVIV